MGKIICKEGKKEHEKIHMMSRQTQSKYVIANYTYLILKLVFLDIILAQSRCGKFPLNSAKLPLKSALALRLKWIKVK